MFTCTNLASWRGLVIHVPHACYSVRLYAPPLASLDPLSAPGVPQHSALAGPIRKGSESSSHLNEHTCGEKFCLRDSFAAGDVPVHRERRAAVKPGVTLIPLVMRYRTGRVGSRAQRKPHRSVPFPADAVSCSRCIRTSS